MASTDARPIPIKNTAFRAVFPILDADGDLVTGATGLDSEVSQDQGTFADCTNEATEIATSSGMYYLDLTSTEMNADCVAIIVKTTSSGAKTTVLVFYPVEAGDIDVDVTAWNGTAVSSPATAGIPEVNVKNINNVSASSVTTVNANQGTTQPINFTGTGASALAKGDMVDVAGAAVSTSTAQLGVNVVQAGGTAWGSGAITAAAIASNAITSAKIASGAITSTGIAASAIGASQLATGAITNAKFAAGAIDAAAIAADAIGASELAADAVAEIADAIWDEATSGHVTAGSYGLAASDILADTADMQPKLGTPAGASVSADIAAMQVSADSLSDDVGLVRDRLNALATPPQTIGSTGNDTTHIHVPGWTYGDDEILDQMLVIYDDSSSEYHARWIADWVNATKLATVATLPFTPEGATDLVWVLSIRRDSGLTAAETRTAVGLASANLDTQLTAIDDYIDTEVAAIKAKTDLIPASPAATSDIPSAATIADAVWDEALSGHTTAGSGGKALADIDTHTDTEVASILAAVDTEVAAIKAKTDQLTFTTANQVDATTMSMAANALTAAATASDFGTEVATAVWASATRTLSALGFTLSASDLAADTIGASELAADAVTEIVNAVLTTAMTESYNADGAAPTLAQAMFLCMQRLTEFAISGTTVTVKKLDGSTTAYTLTLDDATSPTSTTRAT